MRRLLKGAARGKYAKRYHAGTNLVLLDPDIRKVFRNERAVNEALRLVIGCARLCLRRRERQRDYRFLLDANAAWRLLARLPAPPRRLCRKSFMTMEHALACLLTNKAKACSTQSGGRSIKILRTLRRTARGVIQSEEAKYPNVET